MRVEIDRTAERISVLHRRQQAHEAIARGALEAVGALGLNNGLPVARPRLLECAEMCSPIAHRLHVATPIFVKSLHADAPTSIRESGRVGMRRGGSRFGLSVAAPFVWAVPKCPCHCSVSTS